MSQLKLKSTVKMKKLWSAPCFSVLLFGFTQGKVRPSAIEGVNDSFGPRCRDNPPTGFGRCLFRFSPS